ncbi:MAG: dUTP diphosphatase [Rhodobacteraceae bacterium]|nr:dUTP diphosphatase [Paracoccaceae bacterium]
MRGALLRTMRLDGSDPSVPLPGYETPWAAGADLRANLPEELRPTGLTLPPGERCLVPTGIAVEIPPGFEGQIRPRSGLAMKHGVTVLNAPGTVDCDYRGELGVLLVNFGASAFRIEHGARIAQIVLAPVVRCEVQEVSALTSTSRGGGGFGSTGEF